MYEYGAVLLSVFLWWERVLLFLYLQFLPRDALQCKARYCDRMSSVCNVGEL